VREHEKQRNKAKRFGPAMTINVAPQDGKSGRERSSTSTR
jgi:hypothetical protein